MWELNLMLKYGYRRLEDDDKFIKFLKDDINTTEQLVEMFNYYYKYGMTEKELTKVINYIKYDYPD